MKQAIRSTASTSQPRSVGSLSFADSPEFAQITDILVDRYPGPALKIDTSRNVERANDLARQLLMESRGRCLTTLAPMIVEAQGTGSSRHTVKLATGQAIDLTVIAVGDVFLLLGNDTTYDHNLRTALMDSRQRYKDFVECSSDFAWETNADGGFDFVSPGGALGYTAKQFTTRRPGDFDARSNSKRLPFHARKETENVDVWMRGST